MPYEVIVVGNTDWDKELRKDVKKLAKHNKELLKQVKELKQQSIDVINFIFDDIEQNVKSYKRDKATFDKIKEFYLNYIQK